MFERGGMGRARPAKKGHNFIGYASAAAYDQVCQRFGRTFALLRA
jgi:hypothetical protein